VCQVRRDLDWLAGAEHFESLLLFLPTAFFHKLLRSRLGLWRLFVHEPLGH
jgi:hypothetical protein